VEQLQFGLGAMGRRNSINVVLLLEGFEIKLLSFIISVLKYIIYRHFSPKALRRTLKQPLSS